MADLTYDLAVLGELSSKMSNLSSKLKSDGGLGSVSADEVNSSSVADALDDFAGNWDDKRTELAESLDSLAQMVDKAVEGFDGTDRDLAKKAAEIVEDNQAAQDQAEQDQADQRDNIENGEA